MTQQQPIQQLPQPFVSEVAWIRQQIEDTYQGYSNGLYGLSEGSSQHDVIISKMERVGEYNERLKRLVGEEEAVKITIAAMQSGCEKAEQQNEERIS